MQKKVIINTIIFISICVFVFGGYALGRIIKSKEVLSDAMNEKMAMKDKKAMLEMHHNSITVDKYRLNPTLQIVTLPDSMGGYNLHILTNNFYFTPKEAGNTPVQNTGHAHVFVNEVKIGRAYSDWFYISPDFLSKGTNTLRVALNANDHSTWLNNKTGKEISTSSDIFVK